MTGFLTSNWIWILLIVGMLGMHLSHRHGGHRSGTGMGGGCGGGHTGHDAHQDHHVGHNERDDHSGPSDQRPDLRKHVGPAHAGDDEPSSTHARRHGGC